MALDSLSAAHTVRPSVSPIQAIVRLLRHALPQAARQVEQSCENIGEGFIQLAQHCRQLRAGLEDTTSSRAALAQQAIAMEQQCARLISLLQFQDRNSQISHNLAYLLDAYEAAPHTADAAGLGEVMPMGELRELYFRALRHESLDASQPTLSPAPTPEELF